jgi:undecaprenyl pyrophosphate phosphatase UppP
MDSISIDNMTSLFTKLSKSVSNLDTSAILGLIIAVGFVSLIYGFISESILNANTIITTIFVGTVVYIYMKNHYTKKIKELMVKNKTLKMDSILDELCFGSEVGDKVTCDNYKTAKTNFYEISNKLIQNYNWKK